MTVLRSVLRRTVPAVVAALALSGCAQVIEGTGETSDGVRPNVPPSDLNVIGSTEEEIDTLSRNALADLNTYWEDAFPEVYGAEFEPLAGGYASVDPDNFDDEDYPDDLGCFDGPEDVENNAFYCFPNADGGDNIVYDRTLLASLAADYGRFIPALVMAHEFGHAIQGREAPNSNFSIVFETQADCFAGAWSRWVADDEAEHFYIRPSELDDVLRGYLLLRDAPGSGPMDDGAHGSYFDRVSSFQEGFDSGAQACKDNYTDNRIFTQQGFNTQTDFDQGGNAPYDETFTIGTNTLDAFWETQFADVFGSDFEAPAVEGFAGGRPQCDGARQRRDVTYCQAENRVDYDDGALMPTLHAEIGDFAVVTLLSIQYAQAARDQLGLDYRGEEALRSSICLTGWYANQFFLQNIDAGAVISPGDVDESVQVLLEYGESPTVLPDVGLSGFQLVDLFRQGFVRGVPACDVGV